MDYLNHLSWRCNDCDEDFSVFVAYKKQSIWSLSVTHRVKYCPLCGGQNGVLVEDDDEALPFDEPPTEV